MTAKIIGSFKQAIDTFTLVPSDGGRFEVVVDGETIYSKRATGKFPDEDEILTQLRQR